jgi:flagellar hook-length control protein FliK
MIIQTPHGLASPPPSPAADSSSNISLPLPAEGTPAAAPHARDSGTQKVSEPHRADPADARDMPPAAGNHPSAAATAGTLATGTQPVKFATGSDAVSETAALTTRSDAPQVGPSPTATAPILAPIQDQPSMPAERAAPTDQITPALVGLLTTPDGAQSVTVRLQPAELGQVQIRIDQPVEGPPHIDITADRPETLQMLQRDEPRLQQVLDQAGVMSTGRTVSFQVSVPDQVGATASRPDSMAAGSGSSGQGQSGGAWRQSNDTWSGSGSGTDSDQGQARARWFRAGLDITA